MLHKAQEAKFDWPNVAGQQPSQPPPKRARGAPRGRYRAQGRGGSRGGVSQGFRGQGLTRGTQRGRGRGYGTLTPRGTTEDAVRQLLDRQQGMIAASQQQQGQQQGQQQQEDQLYPDIGDILDDELVEAAEAALVIDLTDD